MATRSIRTVKWDPSAITSRSEDTEIGPSGWSSPKDTRAVARWVKVLRSTSTCPE
jgi:hypothetical protein